jgi:predicted MFS family arabinose efflux permease
MRSDAQHLGWLLTAQGSGGLVAGFLVGQLAKSVPQGRLVAWGLLATALLLLGLVNWPHFRQAVALMAAIGGVVMTWLVSARTLLQLGVGDAYRGRVFGALGTTTRWPVWAAWGYRPCWETRWERRAS